MKASKDITTESYNKIAEAWYNAHPNKDYWVDEFKIFKKLIKGKKILEIGFGPGRDASFFLKEGYSYTGIDSSKEFLKISKKRFPKADFKLMDFYHINFKPRSFDGVWSVATLLHSPKDKISKILKSINDILNPKGIAFISMQEKLSYEKSIRGKVIDEGYFTDIREGVEAKRWMSFYTKEEFDKLLAQSGFNIIEFHKKQEDEYKTWLCYFIERSK